MASIGLVKAEVNYGSAIQSTSANGTTQSEERYDLIGMNVSDSTVEKFKAVYKLKTLSVVLPPDTTQ